MGEKELLTIQDITKYSVELMAQKASIDILHGTMKFGNYPERKYTKLEKFKMWYYDWKQRFKDCYTILSGGDIHENCGY